MWCAGLFCNVMEVEVDGHKQAEATSQKDRETQAKQVERK